MFQYIQGLLPFMKKLLLGVMVALIGSFTSAWAVKVTSLYDVDLPVASQAEEVRTEAMRQGLQQVLIKVSGDLEVDKNADIIATLKRATDYVQEYSYRAPTEQTTMPYVLHISYDKTYVNKLLKRSGLSSWGTSRPLVLVWLAVTNADNVTDIVTDESHSTVLNAMRDQAKRYGLPLIFPVMDPMDIEKVSADNIANMDLEQLQEGAKRYSPDAMLIGSIRETKSGLEGQWQLVMNENQWDYVTDDKSVDKMITSVLNQASQSLTKRIAIKPVEVPELWLTLEVKNIADKSDLMQLVQYLKQLTPVQKVQLSSVMGDRVEMEVLVRGSQYSFQQTAELGQHLELKSQDDDNARLVYEWVH